MHTVVKIDRMVSMETKVYADNRVVDIYKPDPTIDKAGCLVVHLHGGGFRQGVHNHPPEIAVCKDLAAAGHVVASGQYRLLMAGVDSNDAAEAGLAMQAAQEAAVNDLRRILALLQQDPALDNRPLVLMGSSAGAVTAMNTCLWSATDKLEDGVAATPELAGIIACAGHCRLCDAQDQLLSDRLRPALLFHGTDDPIVTYYAKHSRHDTNTLLAGSAWLRELLHEAGKAYIAYSALGSQHEWAWQPFHSAEHRQAMHRFLDEVIIKQQLIQEHHRFVWRQPIATP